jgi:hypothetical protein
MAMAVIVRHVVGSPVVLIAAPAGGTGSAVIPAIF